MSETPQPGVGRALGWTALGTVLPGVGLMRRSKVLGTVVLGGFLSVIALLAFKATTDLGWFARGLASTTRLQLLRILLVTAAVGWPAVVVGTWLVQRPRPTTARQRGAAALVVGLLCFAVTAPLAWAVELTSVQISTIEGLFGRTRRSQTAPGADAWKDKARLNLLLLGGDSSADRRSRGFEGIRTDTMILASINTSSGELTLVQLPRNLARAPFPAGRLRDAYPNGFYDGVSGANQNYALNAIWPVVPKEHPELFTDSDQPGADALKMSVGEITGLVPDYFVLVDLDGLSELVDAMGGVRVNINQRLPIGGSSDHPERTSGWLEPGPDQLLNGYHALWYGRSRWADPAGDFGRMARQRCLVKAIVDQADPATMLTKYEAIAGASKDMVQTDLTSQVLPDMADLALRVKRSGKVRSVLFVNGKDGFHSSNPDFAMIRQRVAEAIGSPSPAPETTNPSETATPSPEATPTASRHSTRKSKDRGTSRSGMGASSPGTTGPTTATGSAGPEDLGDICGYHPSPSATPSR